MVKINKKLIGFGVSAMIVVGSTIGIYNDANELHQYNNNEVVIDSLKTKYNGSLESDIRMFGLHKVNKKDVKYKYVSINKLNLKDYYRNNVVSITQGRKSMLFKEDRFNIGTIDVKVFGDSLNKYVENKVLNLSSFDKTYSKELYEHIETLVGNKYNYKDKIFVIAYDSNYNLLDIESTDIKINKNKLVNSVYDIKLRNYPTEVDELKSKFESKIKDSKQYVKLET